MWLCMTLKIQVTESFVNELETKLILPIYYTNATSFLLQIKEVNSRRCILTQFYFYLQHLSASLKEKEKEITELTKRVLLLIRKLNKGKEYVDYLQMHNNRENVWVEWKEKKFPEMVPKRQVIQHEVYSISTQACAAGDRRTLCRESRLNSLVV